MWRALSVVVAMQFLALGAAYGCEGQTGKVIFKDDFSDDSGGWNLTPPDNSIKPPNFVFDMKKVSNLASQNMTFNATEADYCMDFILPKAAAASDHFPNIGLEFWATDYANLWMIELSANGSMALFRKQAGNWESLYSVSAVPGFNPGAANTIRVNTIGGKISVYLNGNLVKVTRAQIPSGEMKFGVYVNWDKVGEHPPVMIKSFSVTSGG